MVKKLKKLFLLGTTLLLASCIDDTYDLNTKELSLDMKIEGNRIALPLGSFRPIVLDSILDLSSIPVLEADSVSRSYNLSLNDSVVTRVAKKDLEVLKEVARLSSDIAPVSIGLEEIRFKFPAFEHTDSMSFENVELSDVSLDAIHEEINLSLDDFEIAPIAISENSRDVTFDIPTVELDDIRIDEYSQTASFNIDDVVIENVASEAVNDAFAISVAQIPMDKISAPTLEVNQSAMVENSYISSLLSGKKDSDKLVFYFEPKFPVDITMESNDTVALNFHYALPEEIKNLDRLVMHSDANAKGALVEFKVTNPSLLSGLSRSMDFEISFPENYELALYQTQYYELPSKNRIVVKGLPAEGDNSYIRFYLSEIKELSDGKYYSRQGNETILKLEDEVKYKFNYTVSGEFTMPATTVGEVRKGLTYSLGLSTAFAVEEVYGSTNPVKTDFERKELDFSFSIDELEYISHIDKVVLDPSVSQLHFSINADRGFGDFDIDYPNSKIVLSFPEEYVFSDNVRLPEGVKRVGKSSDFEISSVSAFNDAEWVLPIREVKIARDVKGGVLDFATKAVVKAVSGAEEDVLTIAGISNVALRKATELLCGDRNIGLSVSPVVMAVTDVQGKTNPIDIAFEQRAFDFDIDVSGLEYVKAVDYVEFASGQKINITSSADKGFGNMQFEEGSYIALRFPEEYVFDTQNSTLPYDDKQKAFVIDDLSQLKSGSWSLALQRVNINKEVVNDMLEMNSSVTLEAVNAKGTKDVLYVVGDEQFSLDEMRKQNIFGQQNIRFVVEETAISIEEMKGKSTDINVDFENQEINYAFAIESLDYINRIGSIELEDGSNFLMFRCRLSGDLGRFNLAANSYVDLVFPEGFELDPSASVIPNGMAQFVENNTRIRVHDLKALDYADDWKLAVKRIHVDQEIVDGSFSADYTIQVVGYGANGEEGKLTIAALDPLFLSEVLDAAGERTMNVAMLPSNIEIKDVEASIDDVDFEFAEQTFAFPVTVDNLDLVKEIKYISFEEGSNIITLNISLSSGLAPFELTEHSVVKITFPANFVLDLAACDFGNLTYEPKENALYIKKIGDIEKCQLKLALERIDINQVIENNQFDWTGEISVTALNTLTGEEGKLYIAGIDDLLLSDISDAMGDKVVTFDVPTAQLRIKEAVMVSNMVTAEIEEHVEIPLDETISEPIDRVDSIGFMNPVPMILTVKTTGLETVEAPVKLDLDVVLPPVFAISSNDDKVTVTEQGLHVETSHSFKDNNCLELSLLVNSLDFTSLEDGYLTLAMTENGGRQLKYDADASIVGSVSIDNAELSSNLLNTGVSLDIAFEMGEVVLSDFTGIYGGSIDKIADSFVLGLEDSFAEMEENGLTLSNTKPELMVSIYNTIGVPVDVDLSLIGRDKEGNAIATSTIGLEGLHIKPAVADGQGGLKADTTRWLFTSDRNAMVPGYEVIVVETLDMLLNELPHSIDFALEPKIVTEGVVHRVDLSKPLELGGHYSISVPFDLQFAQSIPLDLGEEVAFLRKEDNRVTLANPQLMVGIHNPIAQDLAFDLSIVGRNADGQPINSASLVFDEPFVLAAGERNADGSITPKATRWLFAVSDTIIKKGYVTKAAPALATLLNELPYSFDVALKAHFNTDLTAQIDYDNDLNLTCEYGVLVPLRFDDLHFNYADTVSEIKLNLEQTLTELKLAVSNIGLAVGMNLKNTLPLGLTLNLIPLDAEGNVIEAIKIGSVYLPAGDGSDIAAASDMEATPVELSVECANAADLSALDKISFSLDVASGNGDNALNGAQGLQISDITLQIMCDVETDLSK